jgi:hypothetical protein
VKKKRLGSAIFDFKLERYIGAAWLEDGSCTVSRRRYTQMSAPAPAYDRYAEGRVQIGFAF